MNEQHCNEAAANGSLQAQDTALELFQIAALMLGNEEAAVSLVEQTLADVEADPCADAGAVQDEARPRLLEAAMRHLVRLHPGAFTVPEAAEATATCIDTDDLSAAGLNGEQLAALVGGPGRVKMREWLEQLAPALRAIFILRAVVGQDGERTAENLRRSGDVGAQGWQREHVGTVYRQALCSLASSLVVSNSVVALV
jgi:hypothetical protein